jgi:Predicted signal transduction protein with a C-terminal ATPase domain
MERKKMKKRQLKWRILKNIAGVLAVSMISSSVVGYFYFNKVVREQKISDEQMKLQQVASQINFLAADIDNFASSIIVDDVLQKAVSKISFENEFERVKNRDIVTKRLVFYNSMRLYLASSFLEMENNEKYSSYTSIVDEVYFKQKFSIPELVQYSENTDWIYSQPYYGIDTGGLQQVICYRVDMWDKHQFNQQQGTLYLEIYLDYFLEQIKMYGKEYANVCLLGNDGQLLYIQDEGEKIQHFWATGIEINAEGVYNINGGYLLSENVSNVGWRLYSVITDEYIWSRSGFVLYFFAVSFLLSLILILFFTSKVLEAMIRPITKLSVQMEQTEYGHMPIMEKIHTNDEIQDLYEHYEDMLIELKRGMDDRIGYEKQKKNMEFDILLSQIHPHYLYNVLNTVKYLAAAEHNHDIVKIVNALIYTLQETLNVGEDNVETTVEKELLLTDSYLTIQEYRYPQTFQIHITCPEELKRCMVPKTIIQPLVENAILHGILPTGKAGQINIMIEERSEALAIIVENEGKKIDKAVRKLFETTEAKIDKADGRNHIGILNVRDRIRHLYGEAYYMKIEERTNGGTKVTLRLPRRREENIT